MVHDDSQPHTTVDTLDEKTIHQYREQGFVKIPGILSKQEAAAYHDGALAAHERLGDRPDESVFAQHVNVWRHDTAMKPLTLHPNVAAVAQQLAGVKLRLWHDQILIKQPHKSTATEFHQDQPYWPHSDSTNPISAWIALCDVPPERGCMTFIPGCQHRTDLRPNNLRQANSMFNLAPDMRWLPRVTLPLQAGDCTFHHGRCPHMATPNLTDDPRVAHVIIYMDLAVRYTNIKHVVTDSLELHEGDPLAGQMFPAVDDIVAGAASV